MKGHRAPVQRSDLAPAPARLTAGRRCTDRELHGLSDGVSFEQRNYCRLMCMRACVRACVCVVLRCACAAAAAPRLIDDVTAWSVK